MKKKFRRKLIIEIILLFIVAIVIAFIGFNLILNRIGIGSNKLESDNVDKKYSDEAILKEYNDFQKIKINKFIKENKEDFTQTHKLDEKLKKYLKDNGSSTKISIVNSNGEIINSSYDNDLYRINIDKLKPGLYIKRDYINNVINIIDIIDVDKNLYLVATSEQSVKEDIPTLIIFLISIIVIFIFLVRGRFKYIINIEKSLNNLYESDFKEKVPVKYNNELTSLAMALNDMGEKINENKENEKTFLLNISHDLRTPLTSMIGFLNLLKSKRYDSEEERERYLTRVEEQTFYLKTLVDEFFDFARLKWQNAELNKENISLQELIRQVSDGFYPQLESKKMYLSTNFQENRIYKELDVDKFIRVLENLISNGIKYGRAGTSLILNLFTEDNKVIIEVCNIPEDEIKDEELKLFFKRFYKKDSSRSSKGAGLGLSIALEIIKLHEGTLEAQLENGYFIIKIKL